MVLRGSPVRPAPARVLRRAAAIVVPLLVLAAVAVLATPPDPRRVEHRSPDGRLAVLTWSDTAFGQIEGLRVMADPGTPAARRIFEQLGDVPLRVLRWRDARTAELGTGPRDGEGARRLLLTCEGDACRLENAPAP